MVGMQPGVREGHAAKPLFGLQALGHGSDGTAQFTCICVPVIQERHVEAGQVRHVSPGAAEDDDVERDERDGRDRDDSCFH